MHLKMQQLKHFSFDPRYTQELALQDVFIICLIPDTGFLECLCLSEQLIEDTNFETLTFKLFKPALVYLQ